MSYAIVNTSVYTGLLIVGAIVPVRFLISFELLVLFLLPTVLFFFVLNSSRYFKHRDPMDRSLMIASIFLGIVMGAYYLYYFLGITELLWEQGIWFSDNDVLHIGLIFWVLYIAKFVPKHVRDVEFA